MRALTWMACSALCFSTMAIFVKSLSGRIPQFELVFFRSFINLVCVSVAMLIRGETFFPGEKKLLTIRGVAGFGGITCLFYSITHLPLSVAMMLSWSSPIFVILYSVVFFGERFSPRSQAWIGLAFVGLILLLNPRFGAAPMPPLAVAIALGGAACRGLAYITVRAATARVSVNAIVLYFMAVSTLLSAPLAAAQWTAPQGSDWLAILAIGFSAAIAQFSMTQGYRFAKAGIVSTMNLLNAVFSAFFGLFFFHEQLAAFQWTGMTVLGAALALLALVK